MLKLLEITIFILYVWNTEFFLKINAETPTIPLLLSGVTDPHVCLEDALFTANPDPTNHTLVNNAKISLSWLGNGKTTNKADYCTGCYVQESVALPTLLIATNFTNGTYYWNMVGNDSAPSIPCTILANCSNFWDSQWPLFKGTLTGTQCVECSHGYCRGGAQTDDDGNVITNPATCSGFEPIKTTSTSLCFSNMGIVGKLTANIYSRLYTGITSTCNCERQAESLNSPSGVKWRMSNYFNSTGASECCTIRPTCDSTAVTLFTIEDDGPGPDNTTDYVIWKGGDFALPPSRLGAFDLYDSNSLVACTYSSDCDRSATWQQLLNYTYNNFTDIVFGYEGGSSIYGDNTIGAACLQKKCFPVLSEYLPDAPLGWDDDICAPSWSCSYGLHNVYLPPGSSTTVNLNTTLFDVPFMNPCSGAFGIGEIIDVFSDDCPTTVVYNSDTQIYTLVTFNPPQGTVLPLACTLSIICNATLGFYDCDGPGPNARGSIYNTYFIGTAPITVIMIIAIIIGVIIFAVLVIILCVYCCRSKPATRRYYGDTDGLYLISSKDL